MNLTERVNIAANVLWQLVCSTSCVYAKCILRTVSIIYLLHIKLVLQTNFHTIYCNKLRYDFQFWKEVL